jgi:UDP-2-acetamido-2-deoxy-ribo-hexuluronate aminotransferase
VDIDPATFNIDPAKLKAAVEKTPKGLRPRAVIPVDLFGLPADEDAVRAVAKAHGLLVLEDAAQSLGASYKGRKAGRLGDAAATSFFPAKPLGCYGDGGAIFTDDDALAAKLRSIRVHGQGEDKYENVRIGLNGRMDTLQAAILLAKLPIFDKEIEARQGVAARYTKALEGAAVTPKVPQGYRSAWAQYTLMSERRAEILAKLKAAGIPTAIYYPKPLHLQGAFRSLGHKPGDFPVSERASERVFSLPMHPYLDEKDQARIAEVVRSA